MVAFNFKACFAGDVESGKKTQTIRANKRCKAGDILQLYTGQRTKSCRKLGDAVCIAVDSISITPGGLKFGNPGWWPKDPDVFVERIGLKKAKKLGEVSARGGGKDSSPRIATPIEFRDLLIGMARKATPPTDRKDG